MSYPVQLVVKALREMEKDTLTSIAENVRQIHQLQALQDMLQKSPYTRWKDVTAEEVYLILHKFDSVKGEEFIEEYLKRVMEGES